MPLIRTRRRLHLSRPGAAATAFVLAAGAVLSGSAVAATPTPTPGSSTASSAPTGAQAVTFGIGPANVKGIDGRPNLQYSVDPGANTADYVALLNFSTKPLTVNLYTVDAIDNSSGAIAFDPRSAPGTDANTWLTVHSPTSVTLPPSTTRHVGELVVPVSVHVPKTATPGDHLAGIIVSIIAIASSPGRANVNFEQRVALRTFFHVSGTLVPQLSVIDLHAVYHNNWNPIGAGSATVTYRVKNTGNVVLGGKERVTITGLFGSTGSTHAVADVPPLLVGGSFPVRVEVHGVWPEVFMHAAVTVTPESVVGSVNPPLHIAHGKTSFFAIPWALIILVVLLLLLGYALRRWIKRTRSGAPPRHRPENGKSAALVGEATS